MINPSRRVDLCEWGSFLLGSLLVASQMSVNPPAFIGKNTSFYIIQWWSCPNSDLRPISWSYSICHKEAGQAQLLRESGLATGRRHSRARQQPQDDTKAHWWDTNLVSKSNGYWWLNGRYCTSNWSKLGKLSEAVCFLETYLGHGGKQGLG